MTLVTALLILLRSASKITQTAHAVTCLAAKWHVCATLESFEIADGETPTLVARNSHSNKGNDVITLSESDSDDYCDEEDDLDNNNIIPAYAFGTISFQKRQALGKPKKKSYAMPFVIMVYLTMSGWIFLCVCHIMV